MSLHVPVVQPAPEPPSSFAKVIPVLLLVATAAAALLWSHYKLLWFDELIELQTDAVGSVREVWRIQRWYPISLDPALFHTIEHFSTRIFGVTAFAMRLPSLLGFLLAQGTLFLFVRRIAGAEAATLALTLPALSGMLLYAAEARPYGLLYGLYGLSLLLYQDVTRRETTRRRQAPLVLLAVTIACAINLHWFGVLILVPLIVAEAVRTLQHRRMDWPLLVAGAAGAAAGITLILPFRAGVARYGLHYYADGTVSLHTLTLCYRVLFLSDLQSGDVLQRSLMALLLTVVAATVILVVRNRRRRFVHLPAAEFALLCATSLLPWFGYVIARVATHTMAIRYVFAAGLGIAALIACAVAPWLRGRGVQVMTATVLFAALAGMTYFHVHKERVKSAELLADMRFSPEVAEALHHAPNGQILMANVFPYAADTWYTPDPEVRKKLALLYSYKEEMARRGRDTNALTADHMRYFTGFPIEPYEDVRRRGGTALFVISPDRWWDWTPEALRSDGATVRTVGKAYGGTVVEATFPKAGTNHLEGN